MKPSIGIVVLTLNAQHHLERCLSPFLHSPLKPRILVVDSSSSDETVETAERLGVETLVIPRAEFNHGLTREKARKYLNTDIVVMLTPDAYAVDNNVLGHLIKPLIENQAVGVAYARQIPHDGAGFFEAFPRHFNYPSQSHIRGIEDVSKYGVYTFFCSNSCAAYVNAKLDEIGGFRSVLHGEDTVAVSELLRKSYKVAYVAEALVHHSHRYTLAQEFRRYFDTGFARKSYAKLLDCGSTDGYRGGTYVRAMVKHLFKEKPYFLPYAFMQTLVKWLGYRIGRSSTNAPIWFKKALSSQEHYWNNF